MSSTVSLTRPSRMSAPLYMSLVSGHEVEMELNKGEVKLSQLIASQKHANTEENVVIRSLAASFQSKKAFDS
eukprot:563113-Lingulodinium_polyedra.AAC.1